MRPAACLAVILALSSCSDGTPTDRTPATLASAVGADPADQTTDLGPDSSVISPPDQRVEPLDPNASVDRVVDGDTIVVDIQGQRERVRLIGIDTPESVAETRPEQCYGTESADYLVSVLPPGTPITLIRDVEARDQFDRLLAYVIRSADGLFVNLDLVINGYAGPFTFPPNDYYADLLEAAADQAADADIGLWGACGGPDVPIG